MGKKNDPQLKPHYKGLTVKQARFVDEAVRQVLEEGTLNKTKAALKVYNVKNKNVAANMGYENVSKPYIRKAFLAELDARGLNDELSITTFKRQFNASKPQRDYDTGEIVEVPDYPTQLRAVQEYHKIRGYYPDKKTTTSSKQATLNVYASMTPEQLEEAEKVIIDRIRGLEASTEPQGDDEKGADGGDG